MLNVERPFATVLTVALLLLATGCGGGGGEDGDGGAAQPPPAAGGPGGDPAPAPTPAPDPAPTPAPPPTLAHAALFETVDDATWDETAVRKVLHAFAYGGQAPDGQIAIWAGMAPEVAIVQMLSFDEHNPFLSAPALGDVDGLARRPATLRALGEFWSSNDPANGVAPGQRDDLSPDGPGSLEPLWARAAVSRGLNPFRQKIGLWETNYHLAINAANMTKPPVLRYYDEIMEAHEAGLPYERVLAIAASSAAVALQYGHQHNRFRYGRCLCNEDFAREIHQLFFGILGEADPERHETVTIKNSARALTDMHVAWDDERRLHAETVIFGSEYHFPETLDILDTGVAGSNAAERIEQIAAVAIEHPESLANLPVAIVATLADDNLDEDKIARIRAAWARTPGHSLLDFLRGYAISRIFHRADRVKYLTSFDRVLTQVNQVALSNREHDLNLFAPERYRSEGVVAFRPVHDVFGSQTGREAAASALVFRQNHLSVTEQWWRYARVTLDGEDWTRDWAALLPRDPGGAWGVEEVAEWLWQRLAADGLKNFRLLERAHVYALLATESDLVELLYPEDLDRVVTAAELRASHTETIAGLAGETMPFDSPRENERRAANRRIGLAINFIAGTPFVFAQEGR